MATSSTPTTVGPAGVPWSPQAVLRRLRGGDAIAHMVTLVCAAMVLLITVLLVGQLWVHSAASRTQFGWHFLTTSVWDPVFDNYGALTLLYGTVVRTVLALVIAVPLGLGAAIFLSELAPPKISAGLSFVVDLLAAVPSVIYGLLAIFTLLPLLSTTVADRKS